MITTTCIAFTRPFGDQKLEDIDGELGGHRSVDALNDLRGQVTWTFREMTKHFPPGLPGIPKAIDRRVNLVSHRVAFGVVQIVLNLQLHHRLETGNLQKH